MWVLGVLSQSILKDLVQQIFSHRSMIFQAGFLDSNVFIPVTAW